MDPNLELREMKSGQPVRYECRTVAQGAVEMRQSI